LKMTVEETIKFMSVPGGFILKEIWDCNIARKRQRILDLARNKTSINNRPLKLRFEILERDGFRCQYCGRTPGQGATLQIDHISPKSKGGQDTIQNLITSCAECNLGKRDVLLEPISTWALKKRRA